MSEKKMHKQLALSAVRNAKFPSSLIQPDPFTAANAGLRSDRRDADINLDA